MSESIDIIMDDVIKTYHEYMDTYKTEPDILFISVDILRIMLADYNNGLITYNITHQYTFMGWECHAIHTTDFSYVFHKKDLLHKLMDKIGDSHYPRNNYIFNVWIHDAPMLKSYDVDQSTNIANSSIRRGEILLHYDLVRQYRYTLDMENIDK